MCFDTDSRPPIPPIAGGALDAARITLHADDGTSLGAFRARAAEPTGAGAVILPDVRGLHAFYEELALRFAEHGVDAVAIDYFGRTAGTAERGDDFPHMDHVARTTWAGVSADIRAGAAFLRTPEAGAPRSVFSVGFCYGGRASFLASTLGLDLAGSIGFYGLPVGAGRSDIPAPIDRVADMRGSVLGLFGGADQAIPPDAVAAFDQALTDAGVDHELVTYPGAPHSFFDRKAAQYAGESEDAWAAVLDFIRDRAQGG
jgi:carboxymethylenebutenolidase